MKSPLLVMIDPEVSDLFAALESALESHRLDEDSIESIRAHHWDYWYFPEEGQLVGDALWREYPSSPPELMRHAVRVADLPAGYRTSAIITPDGCWHDVADFGWRLVDDPCDENDRALERWNRSAAEIFEQHRDHIAIEVMVHG